MGAYLMASLADNFDSILKTKLKAEFVPRLPPLLNKKAKPEEQDKKQLSRAFAGYVLHKHLDLSVVEACASVIDDFDDCGVDAIACVDQVLYFVQVKLKSKAFDQDDALKFRNGIASLLKGNFNQFNSNVQKRLPELEAAFNSCDAIKLIVGYTGDCITEHAKQVFVALYDEVIDEEPRLDKKVIEFEATQIAETLLDEKALGTVEVTIPFSKLQLVAEPRPTYFGIVKLHDLVVLHQDKSKALYERNIRYFLGTKSSNVNQSIQETLRSNKKAFFYLNNGVTALAESIKKKGTAASPRLELKGLSVINGAQTISSAADYVKKFPYDDIKDARVLLTIIQAGSDSDFGRSVTKARNHQNPVTAGNFAALDPAQENLRRELDYLGYSYHYRPEALPTGAEKDPQVITFELAMRSLAMFGIDSHFPFWLKNEPIRFQQIDSPEYASLFSPAPMGSILVNKVNCYRFIRDVLAANDAPGGEEGERLFYRHGVYLIAAVLAKRLTDLVNSPTLVRHEVLNQLVSAPLDECRHLCWENAKGYVGTRNGVLAFFRNQGNTVSLLERCMTAVYKLGDSTELAAVKAQSFVGEKYPKERVFRYLVANCPKI
jgi:hypothetical protein